MTSLGWGLTIKLAALALSTFFHVQEIGVRKSTITAFAVSLMLALGWSTWAMGAGPAGQPGQAGAAAGAGLGAGPGASLGPGALEGTVEADKYILGPGDVLEIGFWGDVTRTEEIVVNPDGDALVPPVGPLRLTGLTLSEARKLVTEKLAPYYRPNSMSVSLIGLRTFQVHVAGAVVDAGAYQVNAVTRVYQAVAFAGGLAGAASDRNIRLIRGEDTLRVDLTRYILLGDNAMNPFLNDGDVVYVPPRLESVRVFGSVYRPAAYEFTAGETLASLLELAGGFRPEAVTDSLVIARFREDDPTATETVVISADPGSMGAFVVRAGDRVFVRSVPDFHRDAEATILGEVTHPGVYVIDEGVETLSGLLERAGGLTEQASLAEARMVRGLYASRKFPIEAEMDSASYVERELPEKEVALIQTLVREPKGAVSLDFEDLYLREGKRVDPPLYDGDVIQIPKASRMVRVSGQVKDPGLVPFLAGQGASYYINLAGGKAPGADGGGVRVVTALNGQMMKPSGADIRPGDIVWVPRKKDVSTWSTVKDVLQALASVATIYIVIDQISTK